MGAAIGAGAKALKIANANKMLNAIMKNPSLVQKLSIKKFNKLGQNAGSPWKYGPTKNGKGMRIYDGNSKMIMYNYGAPGALHNYGGYYWKVSNGLPGSPFRFPFL